MRQILVVREFDDFSRVLTTSGFGVINCPTIATVAADDLSDFSAKLKNVEVFDGIFLTSAAAAKVLIEKISELKIKPPRVIYVLGKRSFDLLDGNDFKTIYFADANTADEMLEKIVPEDLRGKRFLFIRGEKSLRVVPDFLEKIGGEVDETVVYKTLKIQIANVVIDDLQEKFEKKEIAAACFFSPSQAESFIKQFGAEILHQTVIATIGKTTAEYFERQNLSVDFVSSKSNAETFASELAEYLKEEYSASDFHR